MKMIISIFHKKKGTLYIFDLVFMFHHRINVLYICEIHVQDSGLMDISARDTQAKKNLINSITKCYRKQDKNLTTQNELSRWHGYCIIFSFASDEMI